MEAIKEDVINKKAAMETLFSCLDKGIDDMEDGKVHPVDEAFQIVGEKIKDELQGVSNR